MFAGDGTKVVDERLSSFGHVEHLGRAVHLNPGPVEVVGKHADAHLGVAAGIARLRPLRVRRHDDPALRVHAAAHRGKLRSTVTARGHIDPLVPGTQENEELLVGNLVSGGNLGHERDGNARLPPRPTGNLSIGAVRSGGPESVTSTVCTHVSWAGWVVRYPSLVWGAGSSVVTGAGWTMRTRWACCTQRSTPG